MTQLRSQNWCYGKNLPVDRYSYLFCGGYTEQTAKDDRRINIVLKKAGNVVGHLGDGINNASRRLVSVGGASLEKALRCMAVPHGGTPLALASPFGRKPDCLTIPNQ
ncbi:hypothetical protein [Nostoc sp. NMS8]|uniref:hypothetical protein n=1 Tax=Nostoc sp. NMS8 TaxID=2815392 RepID=UPI0025F6BABE|nr:hypothetical protein [Nostoc sp. NMS8]MBN3960326.1 hypothetical protein [Nostoc sp. NMS8]